MPIMTDPSNRPEDVGEILVKVQEDLQQLRERLINQGDEQNSGIDLSALENAIHKTEQGIKAKTEQVLQQLNNRVLTLPNLEAQHHPEQRVAIETTWDLQANTNIDMGLRHGANTTMTKSLVKVNHPELSRRPVVNLRKAVNKDPHILEGNQMQGPTPGQHFREDWNEKVLANPYNPKNREVLSDNYGIQLPLIQNKQPLKPGNQIVLKGSTIEPLAVLPRANRVDPQLLPPPITEEDARRGILSLIERGLIPPAADLTLDPSPVRQTLLQLHDPKEKTMDASNRPFTMDDGGYKLSGIKLDPNQPAERIDTELTMPHVPQPPSAAAAKRPSPSPDQRSRVSSGRRTSATKLKTPVTVKTLELQPMEEKEELIHNSKCMQLVIKPPPTTPASAPDLKDRSHRFAIQNGRVRDTTNEFMAFKQHYCLSWGSIVSMLKHLEKLLTNYAVPIAFINGDKLADLSLEFELEYPPSMTDLLSVIVNREDVENLIRRPGQRYQGPSGENVAAARIQSTWRMYRDRSKYLEYRHKKWAAGVIAISWVMNVKMAKVRKQLGITRSDQLENFRIRARNFAKNWDRIQSSRRTIIHIPSLGYGQSIRESINEFSIFQNMQMGRLCDLQDPNVDVIYVSPVPVNEEMMQYYTKLLGLKHAIESGNVADQGDLSNRYKIIVPEAVQSFPTHRMCLTSHLKYSPRTLKRIKNLIRGREAFIVTGVPHKDDLHVADMLDVPILCPEPDVAHLYSTKSGSKRIFASANVSVPPGEYDVYSLPQLHECLAQLITENLEVTRWLFKLDDEFDGRGIAYIDVAKHLRCYPWALKEAHRYGEKWTKKWAQEAAYIKIHAEIPEVLANCAQPVSTKAYPNWQKYLEAFLSQGGVIEACPPSDSVTALTADMYIEPNGRITLQCVGDQIHAETPFSCWGLSVPQSSVEPEQLNDACFKVAEACKARGVVGFFAVDFVTFIHPKTMHQMLWAVDLNLSYSDSLAMYRLMQFVTEGVMDVKTHYLDIPTPKKEEKKSRRRRQKEEEEEQPPPNTNRFAVMSTRLHHTNLSVVHYSVFFQMCRAHGIGYDIKEKQGTVFTLIDSFNRENLGMMKTHVNLFNYVLHEGFRGYSSTVGDNLQGALATFARNLSVIHQEISAPNMQGDSNFKPVIEDIEAILGMTLQNAEDASEVTDTSVTEADG